jgi:two-component system, cell cycle response regulator DivK
VKTILVIEDNPHNLRLAEVVLRKGGYAVLSASDGASGLDIARKASPDAILMDIQMPGMDGLAVTRLVKADPATAGIKVLALTALAMHGDERRVREAGCDAYLAKPYHYQDLLDSLRRLLGDADGIDP